MKHRTHRFQWLTNPWLCPGRYVLLAFVIVIFVHAGPTWADGTFIDSDYDRRARKAIETASGADYSEMRDWSSSHRVYLARIGSRSDGNDSRGFYKITVGAGVTDLVKPGWNRIDMSGEEGAKGVEVAWRRAESGAWRPWTEAYARYKKGPVILTIQKRHQENVDSKTLGRDLLGRLLRFKQIAESAGLFWKCAGVSNEPYLWAVGAASEDGFEDEARALREKIDAWRGGKSGYCEEVVNGKKVKRPAIDCVKLSEMQAAIPTALKIAEANGLDLQRFEKVWELTKKVIREGEFRDPNDPEPGMFSSNADVAEYTARRQAVRLRLYKRITAAYLDALLASREVLPECCIPEKPPKMVTIEGEEFPQFNCPDPVLRKLSRYANAIRQIESAHSDLLLQDYEILVLKQQLATDFISMVPLVGDAIDVYSVIAGEDLAGNCYSPFERMLVGVFTAVPVIGPAAVQKLVKHSSRAAEGMLRIKVWMDSMADIIGEFHNGLARRLDFPEAKLRDIDTLLKEIEVDVNKIPGLDEAAKLKKIEDLQNEVILNRTLREAARDRRWIQSLDGKVRGRAIADSDKVIASNLRRTQGPRDKVIRDSNIVPEHVPALEDIAAGRKPPGSESEILILRSVNPHAMERIRKNYKTKGMNVKGKSADWGPHAGFIPVDQKFSKLGNPKKLSETMDPGELAKMKASIEEFHAKVEKCLKSKPPCAWKTQAKHPDGSKVWIVPGTKPGTEIPVIKKGDAYLDPDTYKPIKLSPEQGAKAREMMVLASEDGIPLTADYDFLALGTKGRHSSPTFHPDKGYITKRQDATLDRVNKSLQETGYEGGNLAHHGPETFFPGTPGALGNDPYVSVFDPTDGLIVIPECKKQCMQSWCETTKACGGLKVCGETPSPPCIPVDPNRLLKDYMHAQRLRGYNLDPNARWGWGNYNVLGGWTVRALLEQEIPAMRAQLTQFAKTTRRAVITGVQKGSKWLFECKKKGAETARDDGSSTTPQLAASVN